MPGNRAFRTFSASKTQKRSRKRTPCSFPAQASWSLLPERCKAFKAQPGEVRSKEPASSHGFSVNSDQVIQHQKSKKPSSISNPGSCLKACCSLKHWLSPDQTDGQAQQACQSCEVASSSISDLKIAMSCRCPADASVTLRSHACTQLIYSARSRTPSPDISKRLHLPAFRAAFVILGVQAAFHVPCIAGRLCCCQNASDEHNTVVTFSLL